MAIKSSRNITEPKPEPPRQVPVIYYLSRNGQLEHPHFLQVPLSSPHGLHLRDVIDRLNSLRGQGIAHRYSWSSKRSYKNGYVWQDLCENDLIHPSKENEYVLKGSELMQPSLKTRSHETSISSSTSKVLNSNAEYSTQLKTFERRNASPKTLKSDDLCDYRVFTAKEFDSGDYNDMSTQTGEEDQGDQGGGDRVCSADIRDQMAENDRPSGRIKASEVLIQLIACGSRKDKDSEPVMRCP